jgi:ribonuclease HII
MIVVGVDEAGRGPLAGPVSVGVIAVSDSFDLLAAFPGLNDSKQLSEKKREKIFALLLERVEARDVEFHVELISASYIDEKGIVPAVKFGVDTGVRKLLPSPSEGKIFLDGSLAAPAEYTQETIIGGDGSVPAIMLASVAAKVVRDRVMMEISKEFPEYSFEKHKGYGTKLHFAALDTYGMCAQHRRSFLKNWLATKKVN